MEKVLRNGTEWENGVTYVANSETYDVYLSDTYKTQEARYLQYLYKNDAKKEMPIAFYLKEKKNITLDFKGATLKMHGQIQPFMLDGCENITIKNCVLEFDRSGHTEAEILELGTDFVRLKIGDKFTYRIDDGQLILTGETWEFSNMARPRFFQAFDKETGDGRGFAIGVIGKTPNVPADYPYHFNHFTEAVEDNGTVLLKGAEYPDFWKVGQIIVFPNEYRWLTSVTALECNGIHLEDFRILNGFGMGIALIRSGNLYIDGLKCTQDSRSHGMIANAADVIHAVGCFGDVVVENSVIEGMIDDGLNLHTNFGTVAEIRGDVLRVTYPAKVVTRHALIFDEGDTIAVYNGPTMEKTGEYKILSIQWLDDKTGDFYLDKPIAEHNVGDIVENLSMQPNLTVRNCKIGKANAHMRLQTRGKIVFENNTMELPILLSGDASYWFESSPVRDLTIKNCKFTLPKAQIRLVPEIMPTVNEPYYHENIKVIDNEFQSENPITGGYCDKITFKGNTNVLGKEMVLTLTNCGEVTAENCRVERKTEKKESLNRG